jgi:DNA-binding CsgD family transcriptional regulator
MEKRAQDNKQLRGARDCLHRVILEHKAATEELSSSNRELEALLQEVLEVRSDLRTAYEDVVIQEQPGPLPPARRRPRPLAAKDVDLTRLEREAERVLHKAREAVQESTLLRLRSKRLRSALRTAAALTPNAHTSAYALSKRERQVLSLIVAGKSSKEIAAELGISFKTAVTHRASIMGKLDVHEIASVVREAIRRGLV